MSGTSGSPDVADDWAAAYVRVRDLVLATDDATLDVHVPATPAWRARDLLAHVIGLDRDVLDGAEADDHDPEWTQAHVDARADASTADLLAEWAGLRDAMVAYLRDTDTRPLGDLVIHEQDLRGGLGVPGGRDSRGWTTIRDRMAARLADAVREADRAPLRLESNEWTWQSHDGRPGVVLRADAFDLGRAVVSRRSASQLRSWVVDGDVGPYLDALATVGPLPDDDLVEPA